MLTPLPDAAGQEKAPEITMECRIGGQSFRRGCRVVRVQAAAKGEKVVCGAELGKAPLTKRLSGSFPSEKYIR